jgi:hypothetical protein|nr:MAG TPA: S/T protein kinase PknG from/T protein kinase, PknG, transferase [Caudoviricetes sp.]
MVTAFSRPKKNAICMQCSRRMTRKEKTNAFLTWNSCAKHERRTGIKKYYHATGKLLMNSIIHNGVIRTGTFGEIYFCEKPEDAMKFVAIRGYEEVDVIEFELPEEKVKESFDHSFEFWGCRVFTYDENIVLKGNENVIRYGKKEQKNDIR